MKKTPYSDEPGPRKIDVYNSLQAKALSVGLALILTLIFGPVWIVLSLVTLLIGLVATLFSPGRIMIEVSQWKWLLLAILSCALAVPLYRLWSKLTRQLKELREQMD